MVELQQEIYNSFSRTSGCETLWCLTNTSCYSLGTPKADGTKCGENKKVGCDWMIDSDAIEDKCGVCKGDGTTCSQVEGEFIETVSQSAYTKIVTIPKGARSIQVSERKPSVNILAVKLEKDKTYCINGDNREFKSGDYECAGTMIIYTHPEPDKEVVEMKGPISEDIEIQYAFFNPQDNPGIDYKYYVRSMNVSYKPKYMWDFVEWSECSAKCDGGTMISEPSCIEEQGGRVTPNFCDGILRPEAKSRICNQTPCPANCKDTGRSFLV